MAEYACPFGCDFESDAPDEMNDHFDEEHNSYDDEIEAEAEAQEGACRRHGLDDCTDPECDPYGVLHAELKVAERGAE